MPQVPPHDLDAERAVLSGLMLGAPATLGEDAEVYAALEPAAFYRPSHAAVYSACRALYDEQVPVDPVAVNAKVRELGELRDNSTPAEVEQILGGAVSLANLPHYARIVRELWMRRQLISAAASAASRAYDLEQPVGEMLDQVAEGISSVAMSSVRSEPRTLSALVRREYRQIEIESTETRPAGVSTCFRGLDDKLGGMQRAEFLLLAGRPSMGKTALALAIARNAAIETNAAALVFSLEMRDSGLVRREIAAASGVDGQRLRNPRLLKSSDWPKLANAAGKLDTQKLRILDTPNLTVLDIRAHARLAKARHGLDLVVVDYLGLVRPVHRDRMREREVAEISLGLKNLAKELDVPVLCLAQLNRELDKRDQKRPKLSDLRDSGALEQDADVVLFVHREGYYDAKADQNIAEVIVAKQRSGPVGVVRVGWDAATTRFYDLSIGTPEQQELL